MYNMYIQKRIENLKHIEKNVKSQVTEPWDLAFLAFEEYEKTKLHADKETYEETKEFCKKWYNATEEEYVEHMKAMKAVNKLK